jgi:hypothetical protein
LGGIGAAAAGWGAFEAGWPRLRELEVELPRLPAALDGLRIVHLSDFHLGIPSRGRRAVESAVEWTLERQPDLVAITGDLLTHPRGIPRLRELVERLPRPTVAVLGNHDFALARDPFARPTALKELAPAHLLADEAIKLSLRGRPVLVAGASVRSQIGIGLRKRQLSSLSGEADLRILLCHIPRVAEQLEPGRFDLVLAGHMHDGQICLPYPGGKLRLAHLSARYTRGLYRLPSGTMHVSPGLGTTFVPFRFAARPEATELVLRQSD